MKDWQERIIIEEKELNRCIEKLRNFMQNQEYATLSVVDQGLLTEQLQAMETYSYVLNERISRFN